MSYFQNTSINSVFIYRFAYTSRYTSIYPGDKPMVRREIEKGITFQDARQLRDNPLS